MTSPVTAGRVMSCPRACKGAAVIVVIAFLLGSTALAARQSRGASEGVVWTGEMGVVETVEQIMARQAQEDATGLAAPSEQPHRHTVLRRARRAWNGAAALGAAQEETGSEAEFRAGPLLPQTVGVQFTATTSAETTFRPPDSNGAVGPTQILVPLNGRIKVFDRTGAIGPLDVSLNTFFASVRGAANTGDPRARFDRSTGRWFISCISLVGASNRVLLAVSSGSVISGSASFTFFFMQQDLISFSPNSDTGGFFDYPSLGVDANAVYIGGNIFFSDSFTSSTGIVIRKSSVLGAGPIVATAFREMCVAGDVGPFAPMGVHNDVSTFSEGYFIGVDDAFFGVLTIRRVTDPGGTPFMSGNIFVVIPDTTFPVAVAPLGSVFPVDVNDVLFNAEIRKNRLTGVSTLSTALMLQVGATGAADDVGGRNGARFYQLGSLTTTPALIQTATLFDAGAVNPRSYLFPSVAISGQGHLAMGATFCSAVDHLGVAAAGRLSADPLNTIRAPTTVIASPAAYNYGESGGVYRWGDYSMTVVDPNDDMTMWTFQEFCSATDTWALRVAQLAAPPPAALSTANPATLTQGQSMVSVTLNGSAPSGQGFFDPDAGFPNHIQAGVSGTGVTVNSVMFVSPTQLTLKLTAAMGATVGPRSITITNPDGQFIASAPGILTIRAFCQSDLNADGMVGSSDLGLLLGAWGNTSGAADINGDHIVNSSDLGLMLGGWGACP